MRRSLQSWLPSCTTLMEPCCVGLASPSAHFMDFFCLEMSSCVRKFSWLRLDLLHVPSGGFQPLGDSEGLFQGEPSFCQQTTLDRLLIHPAHYTIAEHIAECVSKFAPLCQCSQLRQIHSHSLSLVTKSHMKLYDL